MKNPAIVSDGLMGAMKLYDETGDKEALLENLNALQ